MRFNGDALNRIPCLKHAWGENPLRVLHAIAGPLRSQKGTQRHGREADAALRRCAGTLRLIRRLLPSFSGPDPDLQLRLLRARRHDAGRGPDRQDRPGAGQAGPAARHDVARHRLRLGRHHAAGDREVRRERRRPDVVEEPGHPRAEVVRRDGQPAQQAGAAGGLGTVRRARRPHRVDRRVRALRPRSLRRLLQDGLQHPAR